MKRWATAPRCVSRPRLSSMPLPRSSSAWSGSALSRSVLEWCSSASNARATGRWGWIRAMGSRNKTKSIRLVTGPVSAASEWDDRGGTADGHYVYRVQRVETLGRTVEWYAVEYGHEVMTAKERC